MRCQSFFPALTCWFFPDIELRSILIFHVEGLELSAPLLITMQLETLWKREDEMLKTSNMWYVVGMLKLFHVAISFFKVRVCYFHVHCREGLQ